jgi:hypothetical protein
MSRKTVATPCPSDLALDRYRLSELPDPRRLELEEHIDRCDRCKQRLQEQEAESTAFGQRMNIPNLAVDALQREEQRPRRWWRTLSRSRWMAAFAATAVAVLLAVVFVPRLDRQRHGRSLDPGAGYRIKGSFSVRLHVKRGERQWTAGAEDQFQAGDNIRFVVNTQNPGYLYIVGIDASRTVTLYEPYGDDAPRMYRPGSRQVVPGAIELDETLGDERILALLCESRLDPDRVRTAAKAAAARLDKDQSPLRIQSLPFACAQDALRLSKRAPARERSR